MKKRLILASTLLVTGVVGIAGYYAGLNHQCTNVALNNDYSFTCDGRKIQGPTYAKEYPTHTWEYHTSIR